MGNTKKYYWLKLKEDFFRDKTIKKLRRMAGGDTFTIIYLKLMLLTLKDGGKLYFEGIEDTFHEEIGLEIDEDPDNVRFTLLYLEKIGLIEKVNEDQMFLTRMPEMIGSETSKAELMRKKRAQERNKIGNNVTAELPPVTNSYTEIEIEKEIEIDREREIDILPGAETAPGRKAPQPEPVEAEIVEPAVIYLTLNDKSQFPVSEKDLEQWQELYPAVDVTQELRKMKGWLDANPTRRKTKSGIRRFINGWLAKEQDKGYQKTQQPQQQNTSYSFMDMLREEAAQ